MSVSFQQSELSDQVLIEMWPSSEINETIHSLNISKTSTIELESIEELILNLPGNSITDLSLDFELSNVTQIQSSFKEGPKTMDWVGITLQDFYFYISIALGSALVLCVVIIIPLIICCNKANNK